MADAVPVTTDNPEVARIFAAYHITLHLAGYMKATTVEDLADQYGKIYQRLYKALANATN